MRRRISATVLRSLNTGTMTDSVRYSVASAATSPTVRSPTSVTDSPVTDSPVTDSQFRAGRVGHGVEVGLARSGSGHIVHHGRPPAPCGVPEVKNSAVRRRPSSRATTGSHPSSRRARVMSGRRRVGSSVGSGSYDDRRGRPGQRQHGVGQLEHGELVGVPDVHRPGERRSRAGPGSPPPRRPRSTGCGSATRRRTR